MSLVLSIVFTRLSDMVAGQPRSSDDQCDLGRVVGEVDGCPPRRVAGADDEDMFARHSWGSVPTRGTTQ